MPHGKKYNEMNKLVDPKKLYAPLEAMELVKKTSPTKFDASVEVHINLGIDVTKGEQQVRSTITLPHSTGKTKKIAAFVNGDKEKEAKEAGADLVGGEELISEIAKSNKIEFDVAIATPDMMAKLAKIAKILGPSGLMPNPKTETVGPNVKKMVEELKKGKVAFKNDTTANLHQLIGKVSMDAKALTENFTVLIEAVKKAKPASSKGVFLKSVTVASTMGPGIHVDTAKIA
ncbi:50S ribosomal protein L1 [Candidatus Uhrbacteria bacterium]|nr:50S ribosomal protein L1 [Candidatus Uhrbacteria bacterium]